jgi:hypothetical protein
VGCGDFAVQLQNIQGLDGLQLTCKHHLLDGLQLHCKHHLLDDLQLHCKHHAATWPGEL